MGAVILSIDAELGWGHHDMEDPPSKRVEAGRPGWSRLVELLNRFGVPATWAVVGHLFLKECDGYHDDHPAPADWFEREREQWQSRPDIRFGPELIEALINGPVDHDIGSHTFSHVEFDERETGRDLARAEIEASIRVANDFSVDFESFVFPRNIVGHRDLLAEYGFRCYRGRSPVSRGDSSIPRPLLRLLRGSLISDELLLVEPTIDEHGLVNVPASMFLYSFEGTIRDVFEPILGDLTVKQAKRGIDQAARRDGVFHMWLHPNNLHREYTIERLRRVLSYLSKRRSAGDVSVKTMADIARQTRSTEAPVVNRGSRNDT